MSCVPVRCWVVGVSGLPVKCPKKNPAFIGWQASAGLIKQESEFYMHNNTFAMNMFWWQA